MLSISCLLREILESLIRCPMQMMTQEQTVPILYRMRNRQGDWEWLQQRATVLSRTDQGVPHTVLITLSMITEHKQAELAVRASEEPYRERTLEARGTEAQNRYDYAPADYHPLDTDGIVTKVNQSELTWLGYPREEVLGRSMTDFLTPFHRPYTQQHFQEFKQRGLVRDLEFEMLCKDGSTFPVMFSATAMRSVTLNTSDLIQRLDTDGHIQALDDVWCETLGYRAVEELQHPVFEVIAPTSRTHYCTILDTQLHRSQTHQMEVTFRTKDGQTVVAEGYVSVRSITQRKPAEEALQQANVELQRALRMKDEFLANMSHELRTPLNAILALSETLLEGMHGSLTLRQQKSIHQIEASSKHQLALINDILDLSKVEAGRLDLELETVPVNDVCQASLQFVKEIAIKKRLQLSFHLNDQLAWVTVDPRRLKQMLVNLLSNAVKFTLEGGAVSLTVEVQAAHARIRFTVQDTGVGIAPDDLPRLFQPFSQIDSYLNRQHEGTGLGLALVHRLTRLHGGSIIVESEVGKGSAFTITLPYTPVETNPSRANAPANEVGVAYRAVPPRLACPVVRLLLAEDNAITLTILSEYLSNMHFEVIVARTGREALDLATAHPVDLILMDIQMPELDGLEVMRRLRRMPAYTTTPIIALTALAMPGDRERCLAVGASAYVIKPVSLRLLVELIQRFVQP